MSWCRRSSTQLRRSQRGSLSLSPCLRVSSRPWGRAEMEWEKLTVQQQQDLLALLQEAAHEVRDQVDTELIRLQQRAAQGSMLARRDGAGLSRQPIPPLPDVKRDPAYEKL